MQYCAFYHTLFKSFVSFGFIMFCLCSIECDEDDELLDKSAGTSGLDFSDDQGDNTGSRDDQGGNTSTVTAREQEPVQGVELVKK